PGPVEPPDHLVEVPAHLGVRVLDEALSREAEPRCLPAAERLAVRRRLLPDRAGTSRIEARDRLEDARGVLDGPGDDADGIESRAERKDPVRADAAVARLQADDATEARGPKRRSPRLGGEGSETHAGRDRRAGAAARAARRSPELPGVARRGR